MHGIDDTWSLVCGSAIHLSQRSISMPAIVNDSFVECIFEIGALFETIN